MKEVHLISQGKGGVGKSLVASFLAQNLTDTNPDTPIHCFDTDPVNPTFSIPLRIAIVAGIPIA